MMSFVALYVYKSIFAYILYFFLFITTVASFFCYSAYLKLKSLLEYTEKEKNHIEQLDRMKMQFFTNISHELLTPITLITSQMESILRIGHLPSAISRKTLSALRNTDKMNRLLTELLDFRKQESGYLKLKISEQDIVQYIKETCLPFYEYAAEKRIKFRLNLPELPIYVWFDPVQLEKVICNLLSNAFRATPENGEVIVEVSGENNRAIIQVSDNGYGIQPDTMQHIFDPFYQEDSKSPYQGAAGIGLALSKGIIDLHGGEIRASNGVNNGAVFTICLYLSDTHFDYEKVEKIDIIEGIKKNDSETLISDRAQEQNLEEETIDNENIEKKYKILLVEDNQEVMNVLVDIFSPYYEVHTAENGMSGMEKAKEIQPELILSDIVMPVMDGLELCKKIKSNLDTSHIPVILLTARAGVEHTVFGLSNGADDYIIKPFNSNLLLARCNSVINNRKALQATHSYDPNIGIRVIAINNLDQQLLDKATQIVEANLMNPNFDIGRFAKEMCLSRTSLFHKIKGIAGRTPNDFILNIRLKKSLILLTQHPDMPIYQIAELVGFDQDTYFMKCFKKHFGETPSRYRCNSHMTRSVN